MAAGEFPGGDYDEWKTTEPDDGPCDHERCSACSRPVCECRCSPEEPQCATCGDSGFSKPGTGYDSVCDDCGGQSAYLRGIR